MIPVKLITISMAHRESRPPYLVPLSEADNKPLSSYNQTGKRTIYKFDVVDNGNAISGKRPIWLAQDWVPDGLKVAANGMVLTGAGKGVDVLDEYGTLVLRVQTNYTVQVGHASAGCPNCVG